ncbi:MAG: Stf0 family sulfotransferase [Sphingomonas sp.]
MSAARKPYDLTSARHDYPAWSGLPLRTITICTHPRSGSTLLSEAMYFAGKLGCPIEYFHRGFRRDLSARWGTTTIQEQIRAAHRLRTDPGGTFAVKLFWHDVEEMAAALAPERFAELSGTSPDEVTPQAYREIAALIATACPNPRFIHLQRRDRVRLAVSGMTAMQTGLWRIIPEAGTQAQLGDAEYDFERIQYYVALATYCHVHWRNFFAAIGVEPFEVTYEALAADFKTVIASTLAWLGSKAPVPHARTQRQSGVANEAFVLRFLRDRASRR